MEYVLLGKKGGTPCVLIHGLFGSGNTFRTCQKMLEENGIHAIAPSLYGPGTDWAKRSSVMDTGVDIAELAAREFGKGNQPVTVGSSAGGKDAIAATIAMNVNSKAKVPNLVLVSAQADLAGEAFSLLSHADQKKLNAIRGVPEKARFPVFQPFRNMGAGIKQRVAARQVEQIAHTSIVADDITAKLSEVDLQFLRTDPALKKVLYDDATRYSSGEIRHSLERLFGWNLDFRQIVGTDVDMLHGDVDTLVHPENLEILKRNMDHARVPNVVTKRVPNEGHMLLRAKAKECLLALTLRKKVEK
jgi:pimeloyl-ACP methyl ester carboxylesterase